METLSSNIQTRNGFTFDPISNFSYYLSLWVDTIMGNPFSTMKKKCIPVETSNKEAKEEEVLYTGVLFPRESLTSPSFNGSPKFYNLIIDDEGKLLQLIFQVAKDTKGLPQGQFIVKTKEYAIPGQPVLARKFIGYK